MATEEDPNKMSRDTDPVSEILLGWAVAIALVWAVTRFIAPPWADFGRVPRAAVLAAGDPAVPLNTCYVARCPGLDDAYALAAVLNSPLAAAWLGAIAEPARGRFRRYLGWTMALLPLPSNWPCARALLAPLGARGAAGEPPAEVALLEAVTLAYGLRLRTVRPLLDWAIQ